MKLSDQINRKFEEVVDVSDWEILSEDGWEDISQSNKTIEYEIYVIKLSNGKYLECADTHILMDSDGEEVFAMNSLGHSIKTDEGDAKVVCVEPTGVWENMYDLSVDSKDHTYYTNGILSHNTSTVVGLILHEAIFNEDTSIGVCSYRLKNCKDIMKRFKFAYENLPFWMKPAVKEYNQFTVAFTNESSIEAQVIGETTFRGNTPKIVFIDELAFVKPSIVEEFWGGLLPSLMGSGEDSNTKLIIASTPNGTGDLFSTLWFDAVNGTNGFEPVEVKYEEIPGRTEKFEKDMIAKFGKIRFLIEFRCVGEETKVEVEYDDGETALIDIKDLYEKL